MPFIRWGGSTGGTCKGSLERLPGKPISQAEEQGKPSLAGHEGHLLCCPRRGHTGSTHPQRPQASTSENGDRGGTRPRTFGHAYHWLFPLQGLVEVCSKSWATPSIQEHVAIHQDQPHLYRKCSQHLEDRWQLPKVKLTRSVGPGSREKASAIALGARCLPAGEPHRRCRCPSLIVSYIHVSNGHEALSRSTRQRRYQLGKSRIAFGV